MILRADKQNKSCFSCFSWNIRNPILNTAAVSNYRNNSEACVGALLHPGLPDFAAAVVSRRMKMLLFLLLSGKKLSELRLPV